MYADLTVTLGETRTDGLSNGVDVVRDLQLGHLLLELLRQLLGGEAHRVDVVGPHAQGVGRRLHHLQGGAQAVVDVHHGQPRVGSQVALELARFDGVVENLDGVVWWETGNDKRKGGNVEIVQELETQLCHASSLEYVSYITNM